jgi:hypothetical protein
MPLKGPRKLSGVALELSDPNARFRVNRVDSVAAGMHKDSAGDKAALGALPEDAELDTSNGHANAAFDSAGEEDEEADELPPMVTNCRRPSATYQYTLGGGGTQYGGALQQMTREALPRLDNYRDLMSIQTGQRPTLDELRDAADPRKVRPLDHIASQRLLFPT